MGNWLKRIGTDSPITAYENGAEIHYYQPTIIIPCSIDVASGLSVGEHFVQDELVSQNC